MTRYKGKLLEPLEPFESLLQRAYPGLGLPTSRNKPVFDRLIAERNMEVGERFRLLFEHYGVEPLNKNWPLFAYKLAEAHVPGLREAKRRPGRPYSWFAWDITELRNAIDDLIKERPKLSILGAATILSKQDRWKALAKGRKPAEILRRKYYDYKPPIEISIEEVYEAFKEREENG